MGFEIFRRYWLRLLRVPPEPSILPGERSPQVFRAAPRYYTWKLTLWGLSQLISLTMVISLDLVVDPVPLSERALGSLIFSAMVWGSWFTQFIGTYILVRLDYEQRWYILTDRSLRIREGILRVTEKTMTFANIQQLTVRQGPLQRLLGISDLVVRSAGGGGGTTGPQPRRGGGRAVGTHTAHFRGVDNAEVIRTAIRDRIRLHRDAGLGDPDDEVRATSSAPAEGPVDRSVLLTAIRNLADEARALRESLGEGSRPLTRSTDDLDIGGSSRTADSDMK